MNGMPRRLGPWIGGLILALIAYSPALAKWDKSGWGDWQQFHHWWEVGRVSMLRWIEIPLWDPHHCGGVPMWGQPQAQVFSPTWWITGLAFGTLVGHKLFIILHHAVGFAGMYFVGRRLYRFGAPAAALSALAWAFSGYFAWRGSGGHSTFLAFHYLPWIFLAWRRAHDDVRYTAGVAALMGLVLFEGGTYPFPLAFLMLLLDTFVYPIERPGATLRVVRTAAISGVLTLLIGAARLWPIYVTMSRFPRATEVDDSMPIAHVLEALTARDPHDWVWGGHRWVWAEYSSFVGWGVVVLAVYGLLFALRERRFWHLPIGVAVFAACSMGGIDEYWPWPLLHELPLYDNLHVPSRFGVLLTFFLTPMAGLALDWVTKSIARSTVAPGTIRALAAIGWISVAGIGVEVMSDHVRVAARWDGPILEHPPSERFHLVGPAGYLERYSGYPSQNVGTMACYDPVPWPIARGLWAGEVPQIRFAPHDAGRVVEFDRTNHTLTARVVMERPGRAIINQNFDAEWRLREGTPVDDEGRLAVDLPAGEHTIEAWYSPSDLPWSMIATTVGLLLAIVIVRFGRRRIR